MKALSITYTYMFFIGFVVCLLHFVKGVTNDTMELQFYLELTSFREDPVAYAHQNNWQLSCDSRSGYDRGSLRVVSELEVSSLFQASMLGTEECPAISHATCPENCHLFNNSCGPTDRIRWFMKGYLDQDHRVSNVSEILIEGPKHVHKIMQLFVQSRGHCEHMLDPHINVMGAAFKHNAVNLFVADFAYCSQYPVPQK